MRRFLNSATSIHALHIGLRRCVAVKSAAAAIMSSWRAQYPCGCMMIELGAELITYRFDVAMSVRA
jgi:hypothetical protein